MSVLSQVDYCLAYLRHLADEGDRPSADAYGLSHGMALQLQRVVDLAVTNAFVPGEELHGQPPDPRDYGVSAERHKVVVEETRRLLKKAFLARGD